MLFLQMQLNLIAHLKLVVNLILFMLMFVLAIGFLQNFMDLFADVMNPFNKYDVGLVNQNLSMEKFLPYG